MSVGQNPSDEDPRNVSSQGVQSEEIKSGTRCTFCWFMLETYPALKSMTERDRQTYKAHLELTHGLVKDIQP
jgi:hypothetical protein